MSDLTALVAGSTGSVTNRSRYRVLGLVGHSRGMWLHSARDGGDFLSIWPREKLTYSVSMSTEFLGADIWSDLTAKAKRFNGKSFVTVAYFGTGAARRLPLKKGSTLVVDASAFRMVIQGVGSRGI